MSVILIPGSPAAARYSAAWMAGGIGFSKSSCPMTSNSPKASQCGYFGLTPAASLATIASNGPGAVGRERSCAQVMPESDEAVIVKVRGSARWPAAGRRLFGW